MTDVILPWDDTTFDSPKRSLIDYGETWIPFMSGLMLISQVLVISSSTAAFDTQPPSRL